MTVTRPHEIDIAGELGDEVTHRRRLCRAAQDEAPTRPSLPEGGKVGLRGDGEASTPRPGIRLPHRWNFDDASRRPLCPLWQGPDAFRRACGCHRRLVEAHGPSNDGRTKVH